MLIAVVSSYQSLSRTSGMSEDTPECSEQRNYQRKALAYFPDVSLFATATQTWTDAKFRTQ